MPDDASLEGASEPPAISRLGTLAELTEGSPGVPEDGLGGNVFGSLP